MNRRANSTARSPALARNGSAVNAAASAYLRAATQQGSSLLELIVALIIVGLLATLALPSYQRHVMRMRRSEAHGVLLELATAQESLLKCLTGSLGQSLILRFLPRVPMELDLFF